MWKFRKDETAPIPHAPGDPPSEDSETVAVGEETSSNSAAGTAAIKSWDDAFALPTYAHWKDALVHGNGCYVFSPDGKRFLDLYGGHCVAGIGHSLPRLVEALHEQAERLIFYSNVALTDTRARALKMLVNFAPSHLKRAFLCNSGAEANETALKLAFQATRPPDGEQDGEMRREVIAFTGAFHGRTAAAQLCNHRFALQYPFPPFDVFHAPFGDEGALETHITAEVAAVIVEPIQSMAGCRTAERQFFSKLCSVAQKHGAIVIFDEVQTGMGRLGTPFAADFYQVEPDIVTTAKSLGGGVPVSAVLCTEAIAEHVRLGHQGTTFGGSPLAAAAVIAVLEAIEDEGLLANVKRIGSVLKSGRDIDGVAAVNGEGFLLGYKLERPARPIITALYEKGILVGGSKDPRIFRVMPPMTLSEDQARAFLETLAAVLQEVPVAV